MRIALIADAFPPLCTSGAVQLRDLSREFYKQGHEITVILPSAEDGCPWLLDDAEGVQVLRLRSPKTKEINHVRRAIAEFFMPFVMLKNFRKSPLVNVRWDAVVWYSPSIFHGPFVRAIKTASDCKSYLIVRDIFPQWAADVGLINRRGLIYFFFNLVALYQYSVANIIGVQTSGNLRYFSGWANGLNRRLEVLHNWLFDSPVCECSIVIAKTKLTGRKIFVYAGNMGAAQNVGVFLELASSLKSRQDIGFLFVGWGSEAQKLADDARARKLNNILFESEIHPDEIPGLYAQCVIGLVALDARHNSHNIPGKFLAYMQCGLPVLAHVNPGNDLIDLILDNDVGRVSVGGMKNSLSELAMDLISCIERKNDFRGRCRGLYLKLFSPEVAVMRIVNALKTP